MAADRLCQVRDGPGPAALDVVGDAKFGNDRDPLLADGSETHLHQLVVFLVGHLCDVPP